MQSMPFCSALLIFFINKVAFNCPSYFAPFTPGGNGERTSQANEIIWAAEVRRGCRAAAESTVFKGHDTDVTQTQSQCNKGVKNYTLKTRARKEGVDCRMNWVAAFEQNFLSSTSFFSISSGIEAVVLSRPAEGGNELMQGLLHLQALCLSPLPPHPGLNFTLFSLGFKL